MPWYIKTEIFNSYAINLKRDVRKNYIEQHRQWVSTLRQSGIQIISGYLINSRGMPGGGGVLILEAKSFNVAKSIIEKDPIIKANLVDWKLHQWIPVPESSKLRFIED